MKQTVEVPEISSVISAEIRPGDRLIVIDGMLVDVIRSPINHQTEASRPAVNEMKRMRIIEIVREHGPIDSAHLLDLLDARPGTLERGAKKQAIASLVSKGLLLPLFKDRHKRRPRWVTDDPKRPVVVMTRRVQADEVMAAIQHHGPINTTHLLDLLGVPPNTRQRQNASGLLYRLKNHGRITRHREDQKSSARWIIPQ